MQPSSAQSCAHFGPGDPTHSRLLSRQVLLARAKNSVEERREQGEIIKLGSQTAEQTPVKTPKDEQTEASPVEDGKEDEDAVDDVREDEDAREDERAYLQLYGDEYKEEMGLIEKLLSTCYSKLDTQSRFFALR